MEYVSYSKNREQFMRDFILENANDPYLGLNFKQMFSYNKIYKLDTPTVPFFYKKLELFYIHPQYILLSNMTTLVKITYINKISENGYEIFVDMFTGSALPFIKVLTDSENHECIIETSMYYGMKLPILEASPFLEYMKYIYEKNSNR